MDGAEDVGHRDPHTPVPGLRGMAGVPKVDEGSGPN